MTRVVLLLACLLALSACSAVPNMDAGSAGCQNARGIGRAVDLVNGSTNMAVMPDVHGKTPAEAGEIARDRGHTVVFNADGACWCVPPPGGKVTQSWFSERGALWLWVDGFPAPSAQAPFNGWGC
jgi:hypothetical protein